MDKEQFIITCIENCFKKPPRDAVLLRLATHIDLPKRCVLLELRRNGVFMLKKDPSADIHRLQIFTDFLRTVLSTYKLQLNFTFILNTGDEDQHCGFPLFQFSRNCATSTHILVPDPHLLSRYLGRTIVDPVPFHKKKSVFVFRGSDTGAYPDASSNQRIAICDALSHKPDCNFRITNFINYNNDLLAHFNYSMEKIQGEYLTIDDQSMYKYIADIDGNTIGWDRNCWALPLNSLLVKLHYDGLLPFETWYSTYLYSNNIVPVINTNEPWPPALIKTEEPLIKKQQEFSQLLLSREVCMEYLRRVLLCYNEYYNSPEA